ncbi:GPN-loop GTPase 2 [Perkinsus olseni]|uniref:GPN-loop GTPase 2 n=1 Tax=Perkinsus olseni TaxID=32597 RepID=A0A7J6L5T2_PEROL|nr:GPN-loop GTPase 2 [Perkinsus olseni]
MRSKPKTPRFGQLVIGPPGSGKSTYCRALRAYLRAAGRQCSVVNLDPASEEPINPRILQEGDNDNDDEDEHDSEATYFDVDVRELVKVDDIAEEHQLGPNGAMVFAMQDLEVNSAWLVDRIEALPVDDYILFDCPGQIELYTHLTVMPHLVQLLTDKRGLDMRLTALNLTDCSVLASEGGNNFISAALSSLAVMLHVELPHLNVLTKCDTLSQFGNQLNRTLDQYLCCGGYSGISSLLPTFLEDEKRGLTRPKSKLIERQDKLVRSLCELIDDYGEVSFIPLSVDDKQSISNLLAHADKANGYAFSRTDPQLCAVEVDEGHDEYSDYYQQRYVNAAYKEDGADADDDAIADPVEAAATHCGYCGSIGANMRCTRCQKIVYCDQRCQRLDWKRHKAQDWSLMTMAEPRGRVSDMLGAILAAGANPNAWSDEPAGKRRTLLQLAIEEGGVVNKDGRNSRGGLGDLHRGGRLYNVQLLLDAKADPNKASEPSADHLPLFTALELEDDVLVRALLLAKADPNIKRTDGGHTPLHLAVRSQLYKSCEMLLRAGADVDAEDAGGRSALHCAGAGPMAIINSLTAFGADPLHTAPRSGETILHTFAAFENTIPDTIDWIALKAPQLLSSQPPPTHLTPLHVAAKRGHFSTCLRLVDRGADLNQRGGRNLRHTAITLADKHGHHELAKALYHRKTMMCTATWSEWLHNPSIQTTIAFIAVMLWLNRALLYDLCLDIATWWYLL